MAVGSQTSQGGGEGGLLVTTLQDGVVSVPAPLPGSAYSDIGAPPSLRV